MGVSWKDKLPYTAILQQTKLANIISSILYCPNAVCAGSTMSVERIMVVSQNDIGEVSQPNVRRDAHIRQDANIRKRMLRQCKYIG